MDALAMALRDIALYVLVVVAFFGPIEAFLRLRRRWVARRGAGRAYPPLADPWVTLVVAAAGAGAIALVGFLS